MIHFIQYRGPRYAQLEQAMLRRNFPGINFVFVNGLDAYDASLLCAEAKLIVLGGSSELFIDMKELNSIAVNTDIMREHTKELIVQAKNKDVSILGICFGHQLIASSLGGLVKAVPAMAEVGIATVSLHGTFFQAVAGHKEAVVKLPEHAKTLGRSNVCPNQVVSYTDRLLGVQFHPEMTVQDMVQRIRSVPGYGYVNASKGTSKKTCQYINSKLRLTLETASLHSLYGGTL